VGGFTITSPPQATSLNQEDPHIELAIQESPSNPPAAFVWRPAVEIVNTEVSFRVGGNFVYPPPTLSREECEGINRAIFIAGGVGINPIMSMISAMHEAGTNRLGGVVKVVRVLYSARPEKNAQTGQEEEILFANRLAGIADRWKDQNEVDFRYTSFITGSKAGSAGGHGEPDAGPGVQPTRYRRIQYQDLEEALGPQAQRANTVVYVCGVPDMTDDFVDWFKRAPGMDERRVRCEKWW
jgi:ferredoxin-NADP reductase